MYDEETYRPLSEIANATLTMLFWRIGQRIHRDILREKHAVYGKQIVAALGRHLTAEFGVEDFYLDLLFYDRNLRRLIAKDMQVTGNKAKNKTYYETGRMLVQQTLPETD